VDVHVQFVVVEVYVPVVIMDIWIPLVVVEIYIPIVLMDMYVPYAIRISDRSLLQNIVSFIGLFCKRDLSFEGH